MDETQSPVPWSGPDEPQAGEPPPEAPPPEAPAAHETPQESRRKSDRQRFDDILTQAEEANAAEVLLNDDDYAMALRCAPNTAHNRDRTGDFLKLGDVILRRKVGKGPRQGLLDLAGAGSETSEADYHPEQYVGQEGQPEGQQEGPPEGPPEGQPEGQPEGEQRPPRQSPGMSEGA